MTAVMTQVTTNRGRPRAEIRQAVYDAALSLFRASGYAATSVDEIVAKAGVAKGTFFNFFPTKAHVLKAYYAAIDAEAARARRDLDPHAPQVSLLRYARAVERIFRREGALMMELLEATISDPAMRRIDEDSAGIDAEEFEAFFQAAVDAGAIRPGVDAKRATAAIMDLWAGAVREYARSDGRKTIAKAFGARISMVFEGLLP